MKKIEDIQNNNTHHKTQHEEGEKEIINFLNEKLGQGFTETDLKEKFNTTFSNPDILNGAFFKSLPKIGSLEELETGEIYYYHYEGAAQ